MIYSDRQTPTSALNVPVGCPVTPARSLTIDTVGTHEPDRQKRTQQTERLVDASY